MPFGKRPEFGDARYAGAETVFACDIVDALQVQSLAWIIALSICKYCLHLALSICGLQSLHSNGATWNERLNVNAIQLALDHFENG